MLLSGERIRQAVQDGRIVIDPWDPTAVGPNSYNVRLHDELWTYTQEDGILDMARDNPGSLIRISSEGYVLRPGKLYLGRSVEYVETPVFVPMLEGRSSIARLGLSMHATAGVADRAWKGHWTFEMSVVESLRVYPWVQVAQMCFYEVDQSGPLYSGKYLNARGSPPGPSRIWVERPHEAKPV